MRILFIAPDSNFTQKVLGQIRVAGDKVTYIDERGFGYFKPVWRAFKRHPLRKFRNAFLNTRIKTTAMFRRFDAAVVLKGTTIRPATLKYLRRRNILLANWFPENTEVGVLRRWIDKTVPLYDIFCSFDSAVVEWKYPGVQLLWLPITADIADFEVRVIGDEERKRFECDICLVGAPYPERIDALSLLREKGYVVKVFGQQGWERTPLADVYGGPLSIHESAIAYRCAKICLNLNLYPPVAGVNLKTFEICAAGGFQITDFRSDITKLFDEGKEIVVFRTHAELPVLVRKYIEEKKMRMGIARAGYERISRQHSVSAQVSRLRYALKNKLPA